MGDQTGVRGLLPLPPSAPSDACRCSTLQTPLRRTHNWVSYDNRSVDLRPPVLSVAFAKRTTLTLSMLTAIVVDDRTFPTLWLRLARTGDGVVFRQVRRPSFFGSSRRGILTCAVLCSPMQSARQQESSFQRELFARNKPMFRGPPLKAGRLYLAGRRLEVGNLLRTGVAVKMAGGRARCVVQN